MGLARGIDEHDGLGRLLLDDPLQPAAVGGSDGKRPVFGLHEPIGPEERLDNLLRRKAFGDGGEFWADDTTLPRDLVARRAGARGHAEHPSAPPRITVGPSVGEDLGDEVLAPLSRRRHCGWLGQRRRQHRDSRQQGNQQRLHGPVFHRENVQRVTQPTPSCR